MVVSCVDVATASPEISFEAKRQAFFALAVAVATDVPFSLYDLQEIVVAPSLPVNMRLMEAI